MPCCSKHNLAYSVASKTAPTQQHALADHEAPQPAARTDRYSLAHLLPPPATNQSGLWQPIRSADGSPSRFAPFSLADGARGESKAVGGRGGRRGGGSARRSPAGGGGAGRGEARHADHALLPLPMGALGALLGRTHPPHRAPPPPLPLLLHLLLLRRPCGASGSSSAQAGTARRASLPQDRKQSLLHGRDAGTCEGGRNEGRRPPPLPRSRRRSERPLPWLCRAVLARQWPSLASTAFIMENCLLLWTLNVTSGEENAMRKTPSRWYRWAAVEEKHAVPGGVPLSFSFTLGYGKLAVSLAGSEMELLGHRSSLRVT